MIQIQMWESEGCRWWWWWWCWCERKIKVVALFDSISSYLILHTTFPYTCISIFTTSFWLHNLKKKKNEKLCNVALYSHAYKINIPCILYVQYSSSVNLNICQFTISQHNLSNTPSDIRSSAEIYSYLHNSQYTTHRSLFVYMHVCYKSLLLV